MSFNVKFLEAIDALKHLKILVPDCYNEQLQNGVEFVISLGKSWCCWSCEKGRGIFSLLTFHPLKPFKII